MLLDLECLFDCRESVDVHLVESDVVRVAAVNGAEIQAYWREEHIAVDEIYVFVPCCDCVFICFLDGVPSCSTICGVWLGEHEDWKVGSFFAYDFEEGFVGFLEMLERGGVVVVIVDEHRRIDLRDGFCDCWFSLCGAREAEVDLRDVECPADHRCVVVGGS